MRIWAKNKCKRIRYIQVYICLNWNGLDWKCCFIRYTRLKTLYDIRFYVNLKNKRFKTKMREFIICFIMSSLFLFLFLFFINIWSNEMNLVSFMQQSIVDFIVSVVYAMYIRYLKNCCQLIRIFWHFFLFIFKHFMVWGFYENKKRNFNFTFNIFTLLFVNWNVKKKLHRQIKI